MEIIKLKTTTRDKELSPKQLIATGYVPAILYGSKVKENKMLSVKLAEIEKVLKLAGESTLIDIVIDGKEANKVLIKDYQKNPIKDTITHVDFYEVDMTKEINTTIQLNFIGESKAIKELGGSLMEGIREIDVKCLPGSLVNHIDIDISSLDTFEDIIRLTDINLPEGVALVNESNATVATVVEPRKETEEETKVEEAKTEDKAEEKKDEKTEEKTEEKK